MIAWAQRLFKIEFGCKSEYVWTQATPQKIESLACMRAAGEQGGWREKLGLVRDPGPTYLNLSAKLLNNLPIHSY